MPHKQTERTWQQPGASGTFRDFSITGRQSDGNSARTGHKGEAGPGQRLEALECQVKERGVLWVRVSKGPLNLGSNRRCCRGNVSRICHHIARKRRRSPVG